MAAGLSMFFLGSVQAVIEGVPLTFRSRREWALLAFLAVEANRYHRRTTVAALLYPDMTEENALRNLRLVLNRLRSELGENDRAQPFLLTSREGLQWNPDAPARLDVADALRLLADTPADDSPLTDQQARHLTEAVTLYRGEFLQGFEMGDSDIFEGWLLEWREKLHQMVLNAMRRLADHALAQGYYDRARFYAQSQITLDPWQESAYRQLMTALAHQGQRRQALRQYEMLVQRLEAEIGVAPDPQTVALYEHIQAQTAPDTGTLPAFGAVPQRHNLPQQYTPFFGRTSEITLLTTALRDPFRRLVAVVGEGGMGKSRVAIEVSRHLLPDYPDGVWFISLATLDGITVDETVLVVAILNALAITISPTIDPKTQLLNYLRGRKQLLVLDNFESADNAQSLLLELLAAAPQLSLLVTTRHHLTLQAVYTLRLEGLPLPTVPTGALATPSVQLLQERAERASAGWTLHESELPDTIALCTLVHGMPLAIELAAAWVARADVATVQRQLHANIEQLAVEYRDLPPRHRSLRALFNASWQLLTPSEQRLLSALTIFQDTFSHAAALEIMESTEEELQALVRKSLVRSVEEQRYLLHSEIRHFAAEHLAERALLMRRYSDYYLRLVPQWDGQLYGANTPWGVRDMRREWANIRTAWLWASAQAEWTLLAHSHRVVKRYIDVTEQLREGAIVFGAAITPFVAQPNNFPEEAVALYALLRVQAAHFALLGGSDVTESTEWLATWLDANPSATYAPEIRIRYHLLEAQIAHQRNDYTAAMEASRKSEAWLRSVHAPMLVPSVLQKLAQYSMMFRQTDAAQVYIERALVLTRENGDLESEAQMLQTMAMLHFFRNNIAQVRHYTFASLDLVLAIHDDLRTWSHVGNIGTTYLLEGDYEKAYDYYLRARDGVTQVGFVEGIATMSMNAGRAARLLGLSAQAEQEFATALGWFTKAGGVWGQSVSTVYLAWIAADQGNAERADELAQNALTAVRSLKMPQGYMMVFPIVGRILQQRGEREEATALYREILEIFATTGDGQGWLDAVAGLAEIASAQGDTDTALAHVETIIGGMEKYHLYAEEPMHVYRVAIEILTTHGDSRALRLQAEADTLLARQASLITDPAYRAAFLGRKYHQGKGERG